MYNKKEEPRGFGKVFYEIRNAFNPVNMEHNKLESVKSDREALKSDWEKVGQDFRRVMK